MSLIRRALMAGCLVVGFAFASVCQDGPLLAAAPAASPPLGRSNPFKPLIVDEPEVAEPPAPVPPSVPVTTGEAPVLAPAVPVVPTAQPIVFVAIAYDTTPGLNEGPVAAVRVNGRTRFVRVGDTIDGATVVDIDALQLTLRGPRGTTAVSRARR